MKGGYPTLDSTTWYEVIDPDDLGFFVLEKPEVLRRVFWKDFEIKATQ